MEEEIVEQSVEQPSEQTIEQNIEIKPTDQPPLSSVGEVNKNLFVDEEKPIFTPPERKRNEHKATYKARVEYERAKFYGEPVSDYSRRRYERKPGNIV